MRGGGGKGVTYKLISLFIVREERSLLLLLVLDKGLQEDSTVDGVMSTRPWDHGTMGPW